MTLSYDLHPAPVHRLEFVLLRASEQEENLEG